MSRHIGWIFKLARFLFAGALMAASIPSSFALAQMNDDSWDEPLNLSRSGVATAPEIVIDSDAVVHAVWKDDLENFVYTRLDDDQWRAPQTTELGRLFFLATSMAIVGRPQEPIYSGPNPLFIASPGPYIFAFWMSPQGKLFTSRVLNENFEHVAAWETAALITPGVGAFAVTVDTRGEWHLAYFRTVEDPLSPAGLYYTHSKNGGWNWGVPELLYETSYLRKLGPGEANLRIATAGTEDAPHVFIAWDIRPRKQVLLARSSDGGTSWGQPTLIAGPEPGSDSTGPFNIQIGADQNRVVLVWQSDRATNGLLPACSQVYQSSSNAGETWSDPQPVSPELTGCVQSIDFVDGVVPYPESPLYFMTATQGQIFLTAWNGRQWSRSVAQPLLSGFEEPEIYTEVAMGCHRGALLEERLYVIGCDTGGGGDVWATSRQLVSVASWFETPIWSQPSVVTSDDLQIDAVELAATEDGLIHAFIRQRQDSLIYYAYWNSASWSRIAPVFELPEGEASFPAIAAGPGNELFLIVPNNIGSVYFSRVTSSNAAIESQWSTPTRLEVTHDGEIGTVDVAWDAAGMVYVAYSVPVNEDRGIYLVQSKDHGASWSQPLQVFDGAEAGSDLVGSPSLLVSADGLVHIIWKEQSVEGDGVPHPLSVYYSRSEDGGHTFSEAVRVVEEPVAWRELVSDAKGNLHLLWRPQDTLTTVWDLVSLDGGQTWQYPSGLPDESQRVVVTTDSAGRLHVLGVGLGALHHWLWDNSRWQAEPSLDWPLPLRQDISVEFSAAAVNKRGDMVIVWVGPSGLDGTTESMLLYSSRKVKLPSDQTAIQVLPTATRLLPTLNSESPPPEAMLTPTIAAIGSETASPDPRDGVDTNNQTSPFITALLPVALLLLSVLGFGIWRATRAKEQ